MAGGDLDEAWWMLKGWYRVAKDQAPKPCFKSMAVQTAERPTNVDPFSVNDDMPGDEELRGVVKGMCNSRASGASNLHSEDIKGWLRDMIAEEEEEDEGSAGKGDCWRMFVALMQTIWMHGTIPQQMLWVIMVLIPKGGGNYCGLGLLGPFWKVIEVVMDRRLQVVEFHDSLHGFLKGCGCGTATMEAKLAQQLANVEQEAFYSVFIDLWKAYNAMDREQCLAIPAAYGVGPNMMQLISYLCDEVMLVR